MSEQSCPILATSRFGEIKRCYVGCTHLTFAEVSLHFESFDEFVGFAEMVAGRKPPASFSEVEVGYRWIRVKMSRPCFEALVELVRAALEEAAWRDGCFSADSIPFSALLNADR